MSLALTLLGLAFAPPAVGGGLELSWQACAGSPAATTDVVLDCESPSLTRLFATFQPPADLSSFVALDAVLDLRVSAPELPPFWQLNGCNLDGVGVSDARPALECGAASPWGTGGTRADAFLTVASGHRGMNRVRLLVTVARTSSDPFPISATSRYYAFHLDVPTDGAESCDGCATPVDIGWTSVSLHDVGAAPVVLSEPGPGGRSVTINGGHPGPTVLSLSPETAVNLGTQEVHAFGRGLSADAMFHIARNEEADVVATDVRVTPDGTDLFATLDLDRVAAGAWSAVVGATGGQDTLRPGLDVTEAPLRVVSIDPQEAEASQVVTVTIGGFGFHPAAEARLESGSVPHIRGTDTIVSADGRSLSTRFDMAAHTPGLRDVVVINPDGLTSRLELAFRVLAGARVDSLAPRLGADTGSVTVQVYGAGLNPGTHARLVRDSAAIEGRDEAAFGTRLTTTFELTGRPQGRWDLEVTSAGGAVTRKTSAFLIGRPPRVDSVDPAVVGDTTVVTVMAVGEGIAAGAQLFLRRPSTAPVFGTDQTVGPDGRSMAARLDLRGRPDGTWNVVIRNPDGFEGVRVDGLRVRTRVLLAGVSPSSGADTGRVELLLHGRGLYPGATAYLARGEDQVLSETLDFDSTATTLRAHLDLRAASLGAWDIVVESEGYASRLPEAFIVGAIPTLTSVSPSADGNHRETRLVLTGSRILGGASSFLRRADTGSIMGTDLLLGENGESLTSTFAIVGVRAGRWDAVVRNPGGFEAVLPEAFDVRDGPLIGLVAPDSGANPRVVLVAITGQGLYPGTTARLERGASIVPATSAEGSELGGSLSVSWDLSTAVTGEWDVVVETMEGWTARAPSVFRVGLEPEVGAIAPRRATSQSVLGFVVQGARIRTGARATLRSGVMSVEGSNVSVAPDGHSLAARFDLRTSSIGAYDVVVTDPMGFTGTLADGFEVVNEPRVTSIEPLSGRRGDTTAVTFFGVGLEPGTSVALVREPASIEPLSAQASADGSRLDAMFDLTDRTIGEWDVRLESPDSTIAFLPASFVVTSRADDPLPALTQFGLQCSTGDSIRQFIELTAPADMPFDASIELIVRDRNGVETYRQDSLFASMPDGAPWPAGRRWLLATTNEADREIAAVLDTSGGEIVLARPGGITREHVQYGTPELPAPEPGHSLKRQGAGWIEHAQPDPTNFAGEMLLSVVCNCPLSEIEINDVTVLRNRQSSGSVTILYRGSGSFDLRAGTIECYASGGCDLGSSSGVATHDEYWVAGIPPGEPIEFVAQFRLLLLGGSGGCHANMGSGVGIGAITFDGTTQSVAYRGGHAYKDTTLSVTIRRPAGEAFVLDLRVASYSSAWTGIANGRLTFSGLPPGARIRSCHGYDVDFPTSTVLSAIAIEPFSERIRVAWSNPERLGGTASVERNAGSDWAAIGSVDLARSERVEFDDLAPPWGHRVGYRLRQPESDGDPIQGEIWADLEARVATPTLRAWRDATGDLAIELGLPRAGAATIDVLDVAGRRLGTRSVSARAGVIERLALPRSSLPRSGIYFIRLRHAGGAANTRVVLLQ